MKNTLALVLMVIGSFGAFAEDTLTLACKHKKTDFYSNRVSRVKMINNRSKLNQFAFHVSNPIIVFLRNIGLKILTKNKKFLENYLGKIYKN